MDSLSEWKVVKEKYHSDGEMRYRILLRVSVFYNITI